MRGKKWLQSKRKLGCEVHRQDPNRIPTEPQNKWDGDGNRRGELRRQMRSCRPLLCWPKWSLDKSVGFTIAWTPHMNQWNPLGCPSRSHLARCKVDGTAICNGVKELKDKLPHA